MNKTQGGDGVVARDLPDRESRALVAQAVRAERERFNELLTMLPVYVILLAPDYRVPFANRFFEQRFGKSNGKRCFEYLFNRSEPCEVCETYKVLQTNAPLEWEWTGPDGRNYEIHDFPFTDADGSPLIMEVGVDITARKQAEAALKEANERLEQRVAERTAELRASERSLRIAKEELARANERLERQVEERTAKLQELVGELEHFSYTITHDMRAPLRAMHGYGDMVTELCADCPQVEPRQLLRRIVTAADRMDLLITDALNYSKAVRQELPLGPVDPGALLRGMLDSYPELQPSKAKITIEGDLPLVLGNEAGLTQCFSNLLGNAVKFVAPGVEPQVRIRAESRAGWVRLWFEDNGIGIPASMLPHLFEMFSHGSTNAGTGIGLALVRKVMDRMAGKAGVESEEGKGSRFWLDLRPADSPRGK